MRSIAKRLNAFHKDEGGADMVEYILIIAAIALPVLAVVIYFWKDFSRWAAQLWDDAKTKTEDDPHNF